MLGLALADARIESVAAPVRRTLPPHPKLLAPIVDFEALPESAAWWRADAVICALGTTMRSAGSRQAFRRVDHDYTLAIARLARASGAPTFVLNSAMGADRSSRFFYNRVKGEVEVDIEGVGFLSLTIVRPGLIEGRRHEHRPAERLAVAAFGALDPILPRSLRINPATVIAHVMVEAALAARPGKRLVGSKELQAF